MPAPLPVMVTGAFSQRAETTTMARGLGMDRAHWQRSSSHCGSSSVGGAPWLTRIEGMVPSGGTALPAGFGEHACEQVVVGSGRIRWIERIRCHGLGLLTDPAEPRD